LIKHAPRGFCVIKDIFLLLICLIATAKALSEEGGQFCFVTFFCGILRRFMKFATKKRRDLKGVRMKQTDGYVSQEQQQNKKKRTE